MNSLLLRLRYEFDMFFSTAGLVLIRLASVSLPVHGALHRRVNYTKVNSERRCAAPLSNTLRPALGQNSNVVHWKKGTLTVDEIDYLRSRRRSYSNPWHSISADESGKEWSRISLVRLKVLEVSYDAPSAPERDYDLVCG